MDHPREITVLSLCSGYAGLELGLARALENPLRVVAVEVEAYALANLVAKAEEGKLAVEALWPDLRTFPAERFRGCFDFVLAGYPCQPFSVAGKRQGTDDDRHLWPHIERIIEAVRPVWFFGENVPGHLTLGFPEVYRSLRDMGYSVEAGLFTAAEVGAPHRRQRLFVLAQSGKCNGLRRTTRLRRRQWQQSEVDESRGLGTIGCDKWPTRPGQPQYEWEEPRVVEYPVCSRRTSNRGNIRMGRLRKQPEADENKGQGQAQSGVGGATNGPSSRVDRLRLLGNGVVPHQAMKAFLSLCAGEGGRECMW